MTFQSFIAAIMHGVRPLARAGVGAAPAVLLPSCVSLIAGKHTYVASSPVARVNGAELRMQVKPEGSDGGSYAFSAMVVSAAVTTFDGPFRWRIEATGEAGRHESLVVHRIHTRTGKTRRDEWYPRAHLGQRADFRTVRGAAGTARAVYPIPGLLVVKPREDGPLELTVDLTIHARDKAERRTVRFRMEPAAKRQDEFVFLPVEIAENIGKSPAEWDDPGWD